MITKLLRRFVPFKDIGWTEIGEEFTRFQLVKTPWFNVYLHRLLAPNPHPQCHDHPWWFVAVLLRGGYWEYHDGLWRWQSAGKVLYRPAEWSHNVVTVGVSWSVILTGPKSRDWGFNDFCLTRTR